jgi:hypothetical protein
VVGRHHELRGSVPPGWCCIPSKPARARVFIPGHGSSCGAARELDEPFPFDRRLPTTAFCLGDLLADPPQDAPGPIGSVPVEDRPLRQISFDAHGPELDEDLPVLHGLVGDRRGIIR